MSGLVKAVLAVYACNLAAVFCWISYEAGKAARKKRKDDTHDKN